jgi:phenylpropionate dioxygenase-like ring-hydroxylating dioxygenase large terminal subunit
MTSRKLAQALSGVSEDAEHSSALAAECYVDSTFFDLEVERIMRPGWHAVARTSQLPNAGDYRSVDLFGEPIVVLRDLAGQLRAYSRVCRHRAFPFVEGDGNAKRFVCPYHNWTYDLQGELRSAPLMEKIDGFERKDCRLPELPLEEWLGFVLVSLDPNAEPLSPKLTPLGDLLAPQGFAELVTVDTLVYDSPWNWKVMVDNFIESYHHLGVHRDNLQRSNPGQGSHAMDFEGPFLVLENPAIEGKQPFWVAQVFPTLLLALFRGDAPTGTWYEMKIDRYDHFELHIHLLAPPELAKNEAAVHLLREGAKLIHGQDIPMCEGVQKGLQSELWRPSRLSSQEKPLWLFHRYLVEQLTPA